MKDISGRRYGRLIATIPAGQLGKTSRSMYWRCFCDCGQTVTVSSNSLQKGRTKSCGCYAHEIRVEIGRRLGVSRTTHGQTDSPTWKSWKSMWDRCTQIGCNSSKNYLGKGIKVCERWKSFENFLIDMGKRPKGMTIDRIDNSLNYCPENCRWATTLEQGRNRSNNHRLEFQGETLCLSEWEEKLGLKKGLICCRLSKGWSIEKTLTTPTRKSW